MADQSTAETAALMHSEPAGEPAGHGTTCEWCSASFVARRRWARFCGTPCRNAFHRFTSAKGIQEARLLLGLALERMEPGWQARAKRILGLR